LIAALLLPVALIAAAAPLPAFAEEPDPALAAVRTLLAAFNAHDVDAMCKAVTEDAGWYAVDGASIAVEAAGREALRDGMTRYFQALPTVRSRFESEAVSGAYVMVRERASWTADGEERSQSSLAVYRVEDGRVAAVWYYPVEP